MEGCRGFLLPCVAYGGLFSRFLPSFCLVSYPLILPCMTHVPNKSDKRRTPSLQVVVLVLIIVLVGLDALSSSHLFRALAQTCANPAPIPSGFAVPCPVFAVSPPTVAPTGTENLTATPQQGTDYIYTTAYYAKSGTWLPITLAGSGPYIPTYSSGAASGSLGSQILSTLPTGTNYVVTWDWLWDATAQCYKGTGLNQCNKGEWRVQTLTISNVTPTPTPSTTVTPTPTPTPMPTSTPTPTPSASASPTPTPNPTADSQSVLILVNDAYPAETGTGGVGASVYVGQHYAQMRGVPTSQILHLNIPLSVLMYAPTYENISWTNYLTYIQNPIKTFLETNNLKDKIMYIVPTYGIPDKTSLPGTSGVNAQESLDSILAGFYSGNTSPQGWNPYGSNGGAAFFPAHFKNWTNPASWKMYLVTRLDGPSAVIAAGLVDKAMSAETSLKKTDGSGYFDFQHRSSADAGYYQPDQSVLDGYNLALAAGLPAVLNDQSVSGNMFAEPSSYAFTGNSIKIVSAGINAVTSSFAFPAITAGTFKTTFSNYKQSLEDEGGRYPVDYRLYSANRQSYWELYYPFPGWGPHQAILTKVVNGAVIASASVMTTSTPAAADLEFSFSNTTGSMSKNGAVLASLTDPAANSFAVSFAQIVFKNWVGQLTGLYITDAAGAMVWNDSFTSNTTGNYTWQTMPQQAPKALWIWGWYGGPYWDAYGIVPGAIGSQLTSYTANSIRTVTQWCPYFLQQGITATWGAVSEPYAQGVAWGDSLFNHIWHGYNFAESSYIANPYLNWKMVFIGDPLYHPAVFP